MSGESDWRWANPEGVITPVTEWELIAALSERQMPAHTLVWRRGWAEWMPAHQVPELASVIALNERAPTREPKRNPARNLPPPLPAGKVKPAPVGNLSRPPPKPPKPPPRRSNPPPRRSTPRPLPPAAPSSPALPLSSLVTPLPERSPMEQALTKAASPSSPPDPRAPIPTLVDMADATATGTLRPPGAVPPPPRAVPPTPRNFEVLDELPELTPTGPSTPVPSFLVAPQSEGDRFTPAPTTQPGAGAPADTAADPYDSVAEREAMRAFRNRPTEPPTRTRGASGRPNAEAPISGRPRAGTPSTLPRHYSWALFALGTLAGLLAVTVIVLLVTRPKQSTTPPVVATSSAPQPTAAARPRVPACQVQTPAARLARSIVSTVPPYLLALPGSARIAVGFAETPNAASGLVFDVPTLHVARMFTRTADEPLAGIVPSMSSPDVSFTLDVQGGPLRYARTVAAKPSFMLGLGTDGIARLDGAQTPEVVWSGSGDERITEPRVASFSGKGHAVTFRRGGQDGNVVFGWLTAEGRKGSELVTVSPSGGLSGTPTIAENGKSALLAFAWRPNTDVYWSIQLVRVPAGGAPSKPVPFQIPPGGAGAEAISPALSGLPNERWLVQWTEGSTGARQVRAVVLDRELQPTGTALTLSRPDQNAGQGALGTRGDLALALFLVAKGTGHELWGASLKCP